MLDLIGVLVPKSVSSPNIFILFAMLLLFLYSPVFFGDISDFTAWSKFPFLSFTAWMFPKAQLLVESYPILPTLSSFSLLGSTRDPSQVFILLQTIYQAFDELAKRRNVFKVETIGDR